MKTMSKRQPTVEFDLEANAAYLRLTQGRVSTTKKAKLESMDVLLDYDPKGELVGVELLNLKKALSILLEPKLPKIQLVS